MRESEAINSLLNNRKRTNPGLRRAGGVEIENERIRNRKFTIETPLTLHTTVPQSLYEGSKAKNPYPGDTEPSKSSWRRIEAAIMALKTHNLYTKARE